MVIVSTIFVVALLISPIVLLLWVILRIHDAIFGPSFRNPAQAVPYLIKHFDRLTEKDFQKLEWKFSRRRSPEMGNIYALRVSLVINRVTSLKTLASRWNVANYGAGGYGLLMSLGTSRHKRVHSFLSEYYLRRFRHLAQQMLANAETQEMESGRKGAASRARKKIYEAQFEFCYPLEGLHETATQLAQPTEEP